MPKKYKKPKKVKRIINGRKTPGFLIKVIPKQCYYCGRLIPKGEPFKCYAFNYMCKDCIIKEMKC